MAWCRYRQGRYEEAAEQFSQAVAALKEAGGNAAVEAAWMAFVAYHQLATKQRQFVSQAIEALENIQREFPLSDQAKEADFHIAKLRQAAGSPAETIKGTRENQIHGAELHFGPLRYLPPLPPAVVGREARRRQSECRSRQRSQGDR